MSCPTAALPGLCPALSYVRYLSNFMAMFNDHLEIRPSEGQKVANLTTCPVAVILQRYGSRVDNDEAHQEVLVVRLSLRH